MNKFCVIALGGSLIVPHLSDNGGIDIPFMKAFRRFILLELKKGKRFILVIGGGRTTRVYQQAALQIVDIPKEDLDWIGIHAIRLNAQLLRTIFKKEAHPVVIDHEPSKRELLELKRVRRNLFIASGWRPGWSTDFVAVKLAEQFKAVKVIIAGDIPFVYDKDPRKFKNAKPIKNISWREYRKLIPKTWIPGLSSPVDPVAARFAQKAKMRADIIQGSDLKNFKRTVEGKEFLGTIIT